MQYTETDIDSPGPCWGKEEQTASPYVPLMTGTEVSCILRTLAYEGNPISNVQADGNGSMSSALSG